MDLASTRRKALLLAQACLVALGLVLWVFGGQAGSAGEVHPRRTLFLSDSGSIVRGHVGDEVDVMLNESPAGGRWAFSTSPNGARLVLVHTAEMPMACSSDGTQQAGGGTVSFTQARVPHGAAARAGAHGAHAAHHRHETRRHHRPSLARA